MSKSNTHENALLLLLFNNNAAGYANLGDVTGLVKSTGDGSIYASLHTATLDDTSVQNTSECDYTSYARVAVARTTGGWTVTGNSVSPVANIDFPEKTGGATDIATHFALGKESAGATDILYWGALSASMTIEDNDIPRLTTATAVTED
jgi:hypothetical protein